MSDYSPDPRLDPRRPENKYGTFDYQEPETARSSYALVGLLAIAALIGGLLMFGKSYNPADQQAQMPPPTTQTAPANPDAVPAAPLAPARPAPATPRAPQQ